MMGIRLKVSDSQPVNSIIEKTSLDSEGVLNDLNSFLGLY